MKRSKGRKMNTDRQAKSCGKAAAWKPLETGVPTALGNPATDAGFPHSHSHDDDGLPRTGPNIKTKTNTKINTNNKTKVDYTDNLTHPIAPPAQRKTD